MSRIRWHLFSCSFVLAFIYPLRADDSGAAKEIVGKAIKAVGPEEKIAKLKALTIKFKGKIQQMGMEIPFAGEVIAQGADQNKVSIDIDVNGQKTATNTNHNRKKGWTKIGDMIMDMSEEQLKEVQEGAKESWIASLVPLKDKAYTLSSLGEVKVNDRPALGIRVASKGHRDVNLYFDKDSSLLLKTEMRVKDEMSGQEVNQESYYSDYKEVNGLKEAMSSSGRETIWSRGRGNST
jgi:cell division protein ZapA (FtsZ GTPase activity inhibitor)